MQVRAASATAPLPRSHPLTPCAGGQERHDARERALREQTAAVLARRAEEAEARLQQERDAWAEQFREHSERLHGDLSAAEEARDAARLRAEEAEAQVAAAREEAQSEVARLRDAHSRVLARMQSEQEQQLAAVREMYVSRAGAGGSGCTGPV